MYFYGVQRSPFTMFAHTRRGPGGETIRIVGLSIVYRSIRTAYRNVRATSQFSGLGTQVAHSFCVFACLEWCVLGLGFLSSLPLHLT